ncbi:MAG: VOC family protein [Actinomycetota bacterium]
MGQHGRRVSPVVVERGGQRGQGLDGVGGGNGRWPLGPEVVGGALGGVEEESGPGLVHWRCPSSGRRAIYRGPMDLGAFSISLAVADLSASRDFYRKLGFEETGGDGEAWTIMVNGSTVIGLFQGMFESNILTFNPGWDGPGAESADFTDVRELRRRLAADDIEIVEDQTGDGEEGPGFFTLVDPDGNAILIDQHR